MNWTAEAVARLKRMMAEGKTFAVIGRAIGTSKNACIGKARRLGFEQGPRVKPPPVLKTKPIVVEGLRADEPEPLGEVEGGCTWLHGEATDRLFCGHVRRPFSSYCAYHHGRVYDRVTSAESARRFRAAHLTTAARIA